MKKSILCILVGLFSLSTTVSFAQNCEVVAESRRTVRIGSAAPILPGMQVSVAQQHAPLDAIGKITYRNNSREDPLCTAVLNRPDIILTNYHCINPNGLHGEYFWPGSTARRKAPYGSAKIIKYRAFPSLDIAVALLDRKFPIGTFQMKFINRTFPQAYRHKGYWNIAGYLTGQGNSLRLESGCTVNKCYKSPTVSHRTVQINVKERRSFGRFMNGSFLFGYLCGGWDILGIKTNYSSEGFRHLDGLSQFIDKTYRGWGRKGIWWEPLCSAPGQAAIETKVIEMFQKDR